MSGPTQRPGRRPGSPKVATPSSSVPPRVHATVPALDPSILSAETESAVRAFWRQGESANTRRSYQSALKYWAAWYRLRYWRVFTLPIAPAVVIQFVVDHCERVAERSAHSARPAELIHDLPPAIDAALIAGAYKHRRGPLSLATVLHRLSVLSKAHALKKAKNPLEDPSVREFLRRVRRGYALRQVSQRQMTALPRSQLERLLETCKGDLRGVRDRAILTFAWASGGRRRSEVANARMEHLERVGERGYIYRLAHSKTDQSGRGAASEPGKPLMGVAAAALTAWLEASGVRKGAIFRQVVRGKATEPLSAQAIYRMVKQRARLARLDGAFGAHSLRSGFVTEAGKQQVPLGEVMQLTGHKNVATTLRYYQPGAAGQSMAANLLGDDPSGEESAPRGSES